MAKRTLVSQLTIGALSALAIVFTAQNMRPVFAGRAPGLRQLFAETDWRDSAKARSPWGQELARMNSAPWASMSSDSATRTAQFEIDRQAFKLDLVRTGYVEQLRADSLATYAVREAYRRKVPPALVFGVMLVENARFESKAKSNVGAVGLMQVYPRYWVRSLGKHFGTNLRDDETNVRYGVYILGHFLDTANDDTADASYSLRKGLLRYNGCVRGRNTRNCQTYPDLVRRRIEQFAVAQCGKSGYDGCVSEPMQRRQDFEDALPPGAGSAGGLN